MKVSRSLSLSKDRHSHCAGRATDTILIDPMWFNRISVNIWKAFLLCEEVLVSTHTLPDSTVVPVLSLTGLGMFPAGFVHFSLHVCQVFGVNAVTVTAGGRHRW